MQLVWKVPYEAGTLRVVARSGDDAVVERVMQTAGPPTAVHVTPDRKTMAANRRDVVHLEVDIVDAEGHLVPDADDRVEFAIKGPARLVGVENGDILDLNPPKVPHRRAFKGKCLAMVQATDEVGPVVARAHAEGLEPAVVRLQAAPQKSVSDTLQQYQTDRS